MRTETLNPQPKEGIMGFSLSFLLSAEAAKLRTDRAPKFVAHMELASGQFQELDADDADHAHRLAAHWCEHGMAVSAAARRVLHDGSLTKVIGRIHSQFDWDECPA